jgi:hypothetical protein
MSVVSELYKVTVVGDGSTPSIAFNRKVFNSTDIKGVKYDTTTLAETALVNGSDFTVSGAGNESTGVTITPSSSIPSGTNWVMYSDQGSTQTTDLQSQGPFPANTIEYMSDKLAIAIQEVEGKVDRALLMPLSSSASKNIPDGTNKVIILDGSGDLTTTDQSSFGDAITTLTTKGDLLGRNSTDLARLPVGSDDQVLTADSAQALGIKWATPSTTTFKGVKAIPAIAVNATGDGTVHRITYDTISTGNADYDTIGGLVEATGVFTAATRGVYLINGRLSLFPIDTGHTAALLYATVSGAQFTLAEIDARNVDVSSVLRLGFSEIFYIDVGQTVVFDVRVSGSTKTVGPGSTAGNQTFNITLLSETSTNLYA